MRFEAFKGLLTVKIECIQILKIKANWFFERYFNVNSVYFDKNLNIKLALGSKFETD